MDKVKNSNNTIRGFSKKGSLLPYLLLSRITTVVSYLWKVIFFSHMKIHNPV